MLAKVANTALCADLKPRKFFESVRFATLSKNFLYYLTNATLRGALPHINQ